MRWIGLALSGWLCLGAAAAQGAEPPAGELEVRPILVQILPGQEALPGQGSKVVEGVLTGVLRAARYEVVGHGVEGLRGEVLAAAGVELDEVSRLALTAAFDVVVRWEARRQALSEGRAAWSVSLQAYAPGTARLLGSQAQQGRVFAAGDAGAGELALGLTVEACARNLAGQLGRDGDLRAIPAVRGRHGQFAFLHPASKLDFKARALFRARCAWSEVAVSTKGLVVVHAHCPQDDPGLFTLVREAVEQAGGAPPTRILQPAPGVWVIE